MPTSTPSAALVQEAIDRLEAEITEKKEALVKLRHSLPARPLTQDYVFTAPDGTSHTLASLFGEHQELIVVHNMGIGCSYCTLWADGFTGVLPHLENRAAFVVLSPDKPETQAAILKSRHWGFKLLSHAGTSFNKDMGFADDDGDVMPGTSTFSKAADGTIGQVARANFGPGDDFAPIWHFFDLLPPGREWSPKLTY